MESPTEETLVHEPKTTYSSKSKPCPSYRSGTSFLEDLLSNSFSKNLKATITQKTKGYSLQGSFTIPVRETGDAYPGYAFAVKDTDGLALKMDGTSQRVSVGAKWSGKPALPRSCQLFDTVELNASHTTAHGLLSASLSTSNEILNKRLSIKQSLQVAGGSGHEKCKRNASLKAELKNHQHIGGLLSAALDWANPKKGLLTLQSSFCFQPAKPLFLGISSTSKIALKDRPDGSAAWESTSDSVSGFVQYKNDSLTSALSLDVQRDQLQWLHLQKKNTGLGNRTQVGLKVQVARLLAGEPNAPTGTLVIKHKLNGSDHMAVRVQSNGTVAVSALVKSHKNLTVSLAMFPNLQTGQFGWGLGFKLQV